MAVEEEVLIDEETGAILPDTGTQQVQQSGEGEEEDHSLEDDQPGQHNDTELSAAKTEEEREAIRERRRQERQERKQRQKDSRDRLQRELQGERLARQQLEERLAAIERRSNGSEVAQLDGAIKQASDAYKYYKDQIRVASTAGNHAGVADATDMMIQARTKHSELTNLKQAVVGNNRQPSPVRADPSLMKHAQGWMEKNKWYDPKGTDSDSRIALEVDRQMGEEGWNPSAPEYWDELSERLGKYLPHRVKAQNPGYNGNNGGKPRSVVTGSDKGGSPSGQGKGYRLSAERVAALKEANLWEDPKSRAEAIKRYREYDAKATN